VKPGDLERNLARLTEVAKAADSRLATAEDQVVALRLALDLPSPLSVAGSPDAVERTSAASEAVSMEAAFK
jgi:hypothetical protein